MKGVVFVGDRKLELRSSCFRGEQLSAFIRDRSDSE